MAVTWGGRGGVNILSVYALIIGAYCADWDCSSNLRFIITLDKTIHTARCWRDKPLFSLTVANSSKKPSKALWSYKRFTLTVQWKYVCVIKWLEIKKKKSPGTAAAVKCVGLKGGERQGTCEVTWGRTKAPQSHICSPYKPITAADSTPRPARVCTHVWGLRQRLQSAPTKTWSYWHDRRNICREFQNHSHLLGERPQPAAARCSDLKKKKKI